MNIHPCYSCQPAMRDQLVLSQIEALPPIVEMAVSHGLILALGVGNVDWQQAVKSLKSISYDNTITLEVFWNDPQIQVAYLDLGRNKIRSLWD